MRKRDCLISGNLCGPCSNCHRHCDEMHLPVGGGFFCAACCPLCTASAPARDTQGKVRG